MKMRLFNLHTHSNFSDGKAPPEQYVKEAIKQNFDVLGFSEHSPLSFSTPFSISENKIEEYALYINEVKEN